MRAHKLTVLAVTLVSGLALSTFALAQTGSGTHHGASNALPRAPLGSEDATNPGATDSMHGLRTGPNNVTTGVGPSTSGTLPPSVIGSEDVTNPGDTDSMHGRRSGPSR
jgi:hypothetical protein